MLHYMLLDNCRTCKNLPACEKHLMETWGEHYDNLTKSFSCDFIGVKIRVRFVEKLEK